MIAHRVSIEKRPKIVDKPKRPGARKVDLIIRKDHKSALVVTIDNASLVTSIDKLKPKNPRHIKKAVVQANSRH